RPLASLSPPFRRPFGLPTGYLVLRIVLSLRNRGLCLARGGSSLSFDLNPGDQSPEIRWMPGDARTNPPKVAGDLFVILYQDGCIHASIRIPDGAYPPVRVRRFPDFFTQTVCRLQS